MALKLPHLRPSGPFITKTSLARTSLTALTPPRLLVTNKRMEHTQWTESPRSSPRFGFESLWDNRVPDEIMVKFWRQTLQSKNPEMDIMEWMDTDESWIEMEDEYDLFVSTLIIDDVDTPLSAAQTLSDVDGTVGSNFDWHSI